MTANIKLDKLRACPFCGLNTARVYREGTFLKSGAKVYVYCTSCLAKGPDYYSVSFMDKFDGDVFAAGLYAESLATNKWNGKKDKEQEEEQ